MAKGKKRSALTIDKANKKTDSYLRRGGANGESDYAHKRRWLDRNGVWGFDVREPKPWKRK